MKIQRLNYVIITIGICIAATYFISGRTLAINLPHGFEDAELGMSREELEEIIPLIKADNHMGYAEHFEEEPDVYFFRDDKRLRKIECYFFKERLYKIFVIYDPQLYKDNLYSRLVTEIEEKYGRPTDRYNEDVFGINVQHTVWNNGTTILDIRKGAGFIYKVITDKGYLQKKEEYLKRKKAI